LHAALRHRSSMLCIEDWVAPGPFLKYGCLLGSAQKAIHPFKGGVHIRLGLMAGGTFLKVGLAPPPRGAWALSLKGVMPGNKLDL
jgi:hypothetical protein